MGNAAPSQLLVVAHNAKTRAEMVAALDLGGFAATGVASAADAEAAIPGKLAMVLVDGLQDKDTIDFLRGVTRNRSALPVLAIVSRGDDLRVIAAIRAGARACLYSDDAKNGLVLAVREAIDGGRPISNGMAPLLLEHIRTTSRRSSAARDAVRPLTAREGIVLGHLAQGLSYDEVGDALGVTVNTVRTYVRTIYEKLDVGSRTEAVLLAIKLGVVKGTPMPR